MIFNRTAIVQDLTTRCFGSDGKSAALVCAQKVGKTKLLEYLDETHAEAEKVAVCKVNLDLLRGSLPDGDAVSDASFLRFFLQQLEEELTIRIARCEAGEDELRRELDELAGQDHSLQRRQRQQLQQQLRDLQALREAHALVGELAESERPSVPKLLRALGTLKRIGWRVVLIIDDFQNVLAEKAFTDRLFALLRGANNEKKIVSLVASTVPLMEDSLHALAKNKERKTLFNHFRHSQLAPFPPAKAADFLDWLAEEEKKESGLDRPLDDDQKCYLREVAGGSPHFLEEARDAFLEQNRPGSAEERKNFERNVLGPAFKGAFNTLWQRCSGAQQDLLQKVVAGRVPPPTVARESLEREGFLTMEGDRPRVFARLFADFVLEKRPAGEACDELKIYFLASNPRDQTQLAVGKELDQVDEVISRSEMKDRIELKTRMATRPAQLLRLLSREKPQIVHFSSHGGEDLLMLQGEDGEGFPLDTHQIETLFIAAGGAIRLVVFNACYSESQAAAVARHVDCTIGMKADIEDVAAKSFSETFYAAIGQGLSVSEAFTQGQTQLTLLYPGEEKNLTLKPRRGVNPAEIFLLKTQDDG